jgi:hypothetical protein
MTMKIVVTIVLCIVTIVLINESVNAIKNNEDKFAVICAYGASLTGFLFGLCLGGICFGG